MDKEITYERNLEFLIENGLIEPMIKADLLTKRLNSLPISEQDEILKTIKELLGFVGKNPSISAGFHCDLGYNIHVGNNFYAGYNCVMLDYAEIKIGDNCLIGPNVGIYTTGHNLGPEERYKTGFAEPIKIGNNVWIGGNTCIMPGVIIGDNSVIGAGSVVTKDIPSGVIAAGNPCKVIREITEKDKVGFTKKK